MKNISGPLRGWVISLLLHAAALAWLVHQVAPPRPDDTPARESTLIFVTVRPKPPPKPETKPEPRPEPVAATARARASTKPRPASPPVIALDSPAPAVVESTQPAAAPDAQADAPGFDIDAARATARAVAREGGGARGGTALKETTDEKLGRAIEQSRRKDCKTRYSGMGVLAIIPLVKDTVTDTGCKW